MSPFRYPSCSDWQDHQRDGRRDAHMHSRLNEPDRYDSPDCYSAYDDARRAEANRMEREAEEAAQLAAEEKRHGEYVTRRQQEEDHWAQLADEARIAEAEMAGQQMTEDQAIALYVNDAIPTPPTDPARVLSDLNGFKDIPT